MQQNYHIHWLSVVSEEWTALLTVSLIPTASQSLNILERKALGEKDSMVPGPLPTIHFIPTLFQRLTHVQCITLLAKLGPKSQYLLPCPFLFLNPHCSPISHLPCSGGLLNLAHTVPLITQLKETKHVKWILWNPYQTKQVIYDGFLPSISCYGYCSI